MMNDPFQPFNYSNPQQNNGLAQPIQSYEGDYAPGSFTGVDFFDENGNYNPNAADSLLSPTPTMNNWTKAGIGINAITSLGGLYSAFQANKLNKRNQRTQEKLLTTNLSNSAITTNAQQRNQAINQAQMLDGLAYNKDANSEFQKTVRDKYTDVSGVLGT